MCLCPANVSNFGKLTTSTRRQRLQQQPRYGTAIRRWLIRNRFAFDFAPVLQFPGGAGKVRANLFSVLIE
jgi:hypothetical protein